MYIRTRLSVMMFLQFFVWGAWWVTLGNYMKSEAVEMTDSIYWAYMASPIGAIVLASSCSWSGLDTPRIAFSIPSE